MQSCYQMSVEVKLHILNLNLSINIFLLKRKKDLKEATYVKMNFKLK